MAKPQRRVRIASAPGVDDTPQRWHIDGHDVIRAELTAEDRTDSWGDDDAPVIRSDEATDSNDERLRSDVPPHNV